MHSDGKWILTNKAADGMNAAQSMKQRIWDAAAELFLEVGYERTTMSRIAKAVGVSAPALYWYFPSKEVLATSFLEESLRLVIKNVEDNVTAETPLEQLDQFVRSYVVFQIEQRGRLAAYDVLQPYGPDQLFSAVQNVDPEHLRSLRRHPYDMLRTIVEAGKASGSFHITDPSVAALALLSMCDYVYTWFRADGRLSVPEVADLYVELARSMLSAEAD